MAARAPASVAEGDGDRAALHRQLDYFPTPPWAARVGGELVRFLDPEARTIWEPACGEGHMAAPLRESFDVFASDVHAFGFGKVGDFLGHDLPKAWGGGQPDWIVTNPPFRTAGAFARLGLERARCGVALLLRLAFLEGGQRYRLLHGAEPLTLCAVFAERVPMTLGRWDPKASSATAYAWFLWRKGSAGDPRLIGIPPGTRERLTRPEDAGRFGFRSEAGLLDAMEGAAE
jgi:hypothetical protein